MVVCFVLNGYYARTEHIVWIILKIATAFFFLQIMKYGLIVNYKDD